MMSLRDAKRRAVRLSGRSSRVRSAGATQCDALDSAATAIGAIANRLTSASAPAKPSKSHVACRLCHTNRDMRRARTIRIYNGLLPSKFTDDLRARSADDAKLTASLLGGTVARTNLYRNLIWRQARAGRTPGTRGSTRNSFAN